jgi:hypothetical protein
LRRSASKYSIYWEVRPSPRAVSELGTYHYG